MSFSGINGHAPQSAWSRLTQEPGPDLGVDEPFYVCRSQDERTLQLRCRKTSLVLIPDLAYFTAVLSHNKIREELARWAFEQSNYRSRLLYRRGGGPLALDILDDEYVDTGVQRSWIEWRRAWEAAMDTIRTSMDISQFIR